MAGKNGGGRGASKNKLVDQFKDVCPPHKKKDLDALVKKMGGDEEKIMQAIQEWWDEPQKPEEPQWEDVNKKASKKKQTHPVHQRAGGGGRASGRGSRDIGRGRTGRGGGGGRGAGPDRRGRGGRGGRGEGNGRGSKHHSNKDNNRDNAQNNNPEHHQQSNQQPQQPIQQEPNIPAPVVNPPTPKGAWGQTIAQPQPPQTTQQPQPVPTPVAPPTPEPLPEEQPVGVVSNADPTPSGLRGSVSLPKSAPTGNVWATKGSAHLIQAENKPKPPPPKIEIAPEPVPEPELEPEPVAPAVEDITESLEPQETIEPAAPSLVTGLPASVNGANVNAAGWKPAVETTQIDAPLETIGSSMVQDVVKEVVPEPKPEPPAAPKPPPTNVLNMGHWETSDADETSNLDFGFGSFGTENDTPSVTETTMSSSAPADSVPKDTTNAGVSPARPPPGLSIAGVPPGVPAGAVLVSDLESKLEGATLGSKPAEPASAPEPKPSLPQNQPVPQAPTLPQGAAGMSQYNNYGMGMYNYNAAAAGNGFVSMHGAPVLAGGVVPPQKPQGGLGQANTGPTGAPQHLPQGGLYGTPAPAVGGGVGTANDTGRTNDTNANAPAPTSGMPPGMPNTMPYNPAVFYGQQPYQMGQPHGVGGYGYGYGAQFGGVAQGGFGYQQVMGQSGGYPYDDQQQQGSSGGYNKNNSGGYRGGRNHNNGNQYQNQYNPPGYGGQPYGMGYNVDHFGNRGGYGPGNMDPYGMQQQGGSYGQSGLHSFQNDDDHHKGGKKGGRNNGSNLQQFQQQHQQQQPFGLQGGADSNTTSNAGGSGGGGWSNQNAGGWGGGGGPGGWQGS